MFYAEGEQNVAPQNMPFWNKGYFVLTVIKTQKTQEKLFTSPLIALNNLERGPVPGRGLLPDITFVSERLICILGQTFVYQTYAFPIFL